VAGMSIANVGKIFTGSTEKYLPYLSNVTLIIQFALLRIILQLCVMLSFDRKWFLFGTVAREVSRRCLAWKVTAHQILPHKKTVLKSRIMPPFPTPYFFSN
jgi:hypothetical protein